MEQPRTLSFRGVYEQANIKKPSFYMFHFDLVVKKQIPQNQD